jgi:transketolase
MRDLLSYLMTDLAHEDPNFLALSGDHGYALFDRIRKERPTQFINVGIAEQGMVGFAAGLVRVGFRPLIYGLASFLPIRVLEQIKVDLCFSKLPVMMIGDGAGLVYSTLGISHQCGEDVACLRPMPNIKIFSPCDAEELRISFQEARAYDGPAYIRIGKSDRPVVNYSVLRNSEPYFTHRPEAKKTVFIATGSMVNIVTKMAIDMGAACISVPRLKPFSHSILEMIFGFERVCVFEEHSRSGGLASCLSDLLIDSNAPQYLFKAFCLKDQFTEKCGSYQYALSEHSLSDENLLIRVREFCGYSLN